MSNAVAVAPESSLATRLSWAEARMVLGVGLQLGLLVALTRALDVISKPFGNLMVLALAGFVIHALLPLRYRLGFFLVLSVAGLQLVLGTPAMVSLILLGGSLVGICYLPLPFRYRLGLVGVALLGMIALRSHLLPNSVPGIAWPVLGSMFMMRLAIYLYDLAHRPAPPAPLKSLSYFFMLPNVCFPLFPAVDYKTFERTYFDAAPYRIYQRGLHWMARGLLQIVVYRLVYHHFTLELADVATAGQVLQYMLTSFMLYLRISGSFHLAVGLLHLFGFHLPETNHLYWLSSSFTDLFRRANIYWRDAMMNLVYYPTYFRLRGRSPVVVTVVSLGLVFVATWAMHSWMWYWLRGAPLLTFQDMSFYTLLGSLITYQAVRDLRKPRSRGAIPLWSARRGLAVCATMGTQCLLWSYWTATSPGEWLAMWPAVLHWTPGSVGLLALALATGIGLGGARFGVMERVHRGEAIETRNALVATLGTVAVLAVLVNPMLPRRLSQAKREFLVTLRENRLNQQDEASLLRGYYERIDQPVSLTGELTQAPPEGDGARWPDIKESSLWVPDSTLMRGRFTPSSKMLWREKSFTTNRFGLRDREYATPKPPRTFRIALFGPSDVMGSGVEDQQVFEWLLEDSLNAYNSKRKYDRIEILNFAQSRAGLFQRTWLLDHRAAEVEPDLILFTVHPARDLPFGVRALEQIHRAGIDLEYPELRSFVQRYVPGPLSDSVKSIRGMMAHRDELMELSIRKVAEIGRRNRWPVELIFLREPTEAPTSDSAVTRLAAAAGLPVFDLTDFEGRDETAFRLADWDRHLNVAGHAYIADRLFRELQQRGHLADWGVTAPSAH